LYKRSLKWVAVALGAASLFALAAPASAASLVTIQARASGDPGSSSFTSADYVTAWNAALAANPAPTAGYLDQTVAKWNGSQSNSAAGGVNSNLASHDQFIFDVTDDQVGVWAFRLGVDFDHGGTLIIDGQAVQTLNGSLWWDGDFANVGQFLSGSVDLSAGRHTLDVYGFEGCCDGPTQGQFLAAGQDLYQNFATVGTIGGVPEPAAWGLMIMGFGGIGAAMRRRRGRAFAA
jgi:hypothetical protein